jgi:shikimate dehydrogenase
MKSINKDTRLCISISEKPSNFGNTLHNELYKELNLNFIYKSFKIKNLKSSIDAIKTLNIRGCGVSMPYKERVVSYLDKMDPLSKSINAVNTIVNKNGKLKGYNTDIYGAIESLKKCNITKNYSVFMIGAGGAAKAFLLALKKLKIKHISIANRNKKRLEKLKSITKFNIIDWKDKSDFNADLLINATSIGMYPKVREMGFSKSNILNSKAVIDVIINPIKSRLIIEAEKLKKRNCAGYVMSMYQARRQFYLYTSINPKLSLLEKKIKLILK